MVGTSALAMLSASDDPAQQLAASRRFVKEKGAADVPPLPPAPGLRPRAPAHRLPVGDFCSHAVSILTAELYELHDRARSRCMPSRWSHEDGSPLRARVVSAMDHYIRIGGMSDEEAARLHPLARDRRPDRPARPDAGHAADILAYRPAPVQVTYLGFPGPTALPGIDYVIADEFVLPPELAPHFTEKPLYMPRTFQINDRQRLIGATPTRAACGLPEDAFVFCSFNNNFKITEEVFDAWMRILQRVPGSVLWLVSDSESVRTTCAAQAEGARRRSRRAPGVRRPRRAGRLPGALPGGRPVPRHHAVQRRHHRQRRAVGRPAPADLRRPHLRGAHGRQPAARGRSAELITFSLAGIRGEGGGAGARPPAASPP
jgi:predicted O-linked N-acetylglucosamine transferase (SPINDLY family)